MTEGAATRDGPSRRGTVLLVSPEGERRGGTEQALLTLVGERGRLPFDVVVALLADGSLAAELRALGCEVHVIRAGRLRQPHRIGATILRLARLVRSRRIAVVVGWQTKAQVYAGPAARLGRARAIVYQHGQPSKALLDRVSLVLAPAGALTVSESSAELHRVLHARSPVRAVRPGIDLRRFDPATLPDPAEARHQLGFDENVPLLCIVGRLQHWKGIHVLIAAMPAILAGAPGAVVAVVGGTHPTEPDYLDGLQRQVAALGIEGNVRFAGARDDAPLWMQAADVVVHHSCNEPFGLVVIEALALGKPVVAAAEGGPLEIVTDDEALLVPFGDAERLAGAVLRSLAPERRSAERMRLAQRCAARYSAVAFAAQFAEAVIDLTKLAP
jgi:glycosyltransferase involved in cell wall biosynthesis